MEDFHNAEQDQMQSQSQSQGDHLQDISAAESGQETDEMQTQNAAGMPGDGVGRREVVGRSGVYPVSASQDAPGDAPIQPEASWGQGERGAAGYTDSGDSELQDI